MTEPLDDHLNPVQLARELNRCRQHGLDDLDLDLHNKAPVPEAEIAHLHYLARAYCAAVGGAASERAAAIRKLLHDGLAAYSAQHQAEGERVTRLFFDQSDSVPPKSPGDLMADVKRELELQGLTVDFKTWREAAFRRAAAFLIDFVYDRQAATIEAAPAVVPDEPVAPMPLVTGRRWSVKHWERVVAAGLLVVSGILVALALTQHQGQTHTVTGTRAPTAATSHYQPGKTYTELTGEFGAPTFADPHTVSAEGPKIEQYQQVQVSCKVLAPSIASVSPDGYWYRIASPPWNNHDYAAANTFMNGDHVGQTTPLHYTDFAVPDCPS